MIKHFDLNTRGRDLLVGDLHGTVTKFLQALDDVGFDETIDRVFSVGDLVDRGEESQHAIDLLSRSWFHAVRGNHDDMAIRWGEPVNRMDHGTYMANGGSWNFSTSPEERKYNASILSELPLAIELDTTKGMIGIVHAECPFDSWTQFADLLRDTSLSQAKRTAIESACMWCRDRITHEDCLVVPDIRAIVVGHTPVKQATTLGNHIYIDTRGWHPRGDGFTILDAATLTRAYRPLPARVHASWTDIKNKQGTAA